MFATKPLSGVFLAAALLASPMTLQPAHAGQIGFTISPKGEEAKVFRTGLKVYSFARNLKRKNRARVDQVGSGNGAAINQNGQGNIAGVFQRGRGNSGAITQNGNDNAFALIQLGKKNSSSHTQTGNGQVGVRVEAGW